MFYAGDVLAKKGPFGKLWLAAHVDRKLSKHDVQGVNLVASVDSILHPSVPIALRLSGHLMLGVAKIYSRKMRYLLTDCSEAMVQLNVAFTSGARPDLDLPSRGPAAGITLEPPSEADLEIQVEDLESLEQQLPQSTDFVRFHVVDDMLTLSLDTGDADVELADARMRASLLGAGIPVAEADPYDYDDDYHDDEVEPDYASPEKRRAASLSRDGPHGLGLAAADELAAEEVVARRSSILPATLLDDSMASSRKSLAGGAEGGLDGLDVPLPDDDFAGGPLEDSIAALADTSFRSVAVEAAEAAMAADEVQSAEGPSVIRRTKRPRAVRVDASTMLSNETIRRQMRDVSALMHPAHAPREDAESSERTLEQVLESLAPALRRLFGREVLELEVLEPERTRAQPPSRPSAGVAMAALDPNAWKDRHEPLPALEDGSDVAYMDEFGDEGLYGETAAARLSVALPEDILLESAAGGGSSEVGPARSEESGSGTQDVEVRNTWTERTERMFALVEHRLAASPSGSLSFHEFVQGKERHVAAGAFFELLVLFASDYVRLRQDADYSDILVSRSIQS